MSRTAPAEDHAATTVTKARAAEFLKCTTKSVERYAAAGRLTRFENQGPRRNEVHYLESDVLKLRDEQASSTATPTPAPRIMRQTETDTTQPVTKDQAEFALLLAEALISKLTASGMLLTAVPPQQPPEPTDGQRQTQPDREANTQAIAQQKPDRQIETAPSVSISDKPLLTLDECRQLTGLSRNHLTEAIHAKKLKARIIGRAWRIKRADLDAYLKKL